MVSRQTGRLCAASEPGTGARRRFSLQHSAGRTPARRLCRVATWPRPLTLSRVNALLRIRMRVRSRALAAFLWRGFSWRPDELTDELESPLDFRRRGILPASWKEGRNILFICIYVLRLLFLAWFKGRHTQMLKKK